MSEDPTVGSSRQTQGRVHSQARRDGALGGTGALLWGPRAPCLGLAVVRSELCFMEMEEPREGGARECPHQGSLGGSVCPSHPIREGGRAKHPASCPVCAACSQKGPMAFCVARVLPSGRQFGRPGQARSALVHASLGILVRMDSVPPSGVLQTPAVLQRWLWVLRACTQKRGTSWKRAGGCVRAEGGRSTEEQVGGRGELGAGQGSAFTSVGQSHPPGAGQVHQGTGRSPAARGLDRS